MSPETPAEAPQPSVRAFFSWALSGLMAFF